MKKVIIIIICCGTLLISHAQQVRPANSSQIYSELLELKNLCNVLYVAAHPDDENTKLLSWFTNYLHYRTAYLSLTRGDGGQNILGTQLNEGLGLIRTHELLEARKIDGAQQFFSRAVDFGFSKNFSETFTHWNKDTLTNDAVWVIRQFRPDIIICRFPPDSLAGHGQHAASAIIAAKAFKEAGDQSKYAEQLQFVAAFHPKRLLINGFKFGNLSNINDSMIKLETGQFDPLSGLGSGELAGMSRSCHKSQGAGTPNEAGLQYEYFGLTDGSPFTNSIFDGIETSWNRVGRPDIKKGIENTIKKYEFLHPDFIIAELIEIKKLIASVADDFWRNQKTKEIDKIILDCSGILAEAVTSSSTAIKGSSLPFTIHIQAHANGKVMLQSIKPKNRPSIKTSLQLSSDSLYSINTTIPIDENYKISEPYWLSTPAENCVYHVSNRGLIGLPEEPNQNCIVLEIIVEGQTFNVDVPLSVKKLDPVKGDIVERLRIVPEVSLQFANPIAITNKDTSLNIEINISANKNIEHAKLTIFAGDKQILSKENINLANNSTKNLVAFIPANEIKKLKRKEFNIEAHLETQDGVFDKTCNTIQYNHIATLQYFSQATAKVLLPSWKCSVKKIGYIAGSGDKIQDILKLTGLDVDILTVKDFSDSKKLKKYHAIICGIRCLNTNKNLGVWMDVLHQYAREGGTLVMLYNTLQDLVTDKIGPYPITLSSKRVTEEDALVKFTNPKDRILNYPNKILQADFANWVQERGLYFPEKWDDKYVTPLYMHDSGEEPLLGSLLYTHTGKGYFVYTALSFNRQLPAGNSGAIRLLMNMLSLGK